MTALTLQVHAGAAESDAAVRIEVAYNDAGLALERLDAAYAEAREKITAAMSPRPAGFWEEGFVAYYGDDGRAAGAVPARWHLLGPGSWNVVLAEAVTLPPCPLPECDEYALCNSDGRVICFYPAGKVIRAGETLTLSPGRGRAR